MAQPSEVRTQIVSAMVLVGMTSIGLMASIAVRAQWLSHPRPHHRGELLLSLGVSLVFLLPLATRLLLPIENPYNGEGSPMFAMMHVIVFAVVGVPLTLISALAMVIGIPDKPRGEVSAK